MHVEMDEGAELGALADFFRDGARFGDAAADAPLLGRLARQQALTQALSGLFHGPAALVQLRVWVFLQLASQGDAQWPRERIDELFHALRPEALETVLKRLRDVELLAWDETQRAYALPPLAQRVAALLAPLAAEQPGDGEDGGELAALLGQVVGANQLGSLDAGQVQMLHAQLARLHGEFADAIASGSEFRLREARKRYDRAALLIDRASEAISAIIGNAQGHVLLERAARGLGQAQSRLLAMASQFNRALQQVDRQRVTLGTTGITSTDVKRWLQAAPAGTLAAVALPRELDDLNRLFEAWTAGPGDEARTVAQALLGPRPAATRYAQLAYKAQLMPLLGDPQAAVLPGATGQLARQPWRVQWQPEAERLDHEQVELLTLGVLMKEETNG